MLHQFQMIKAFQTARSFDVLSSSAAFIPYHVDLFPSIFSVVTRCSKLFFLMVSSINRACLVVILIVIFFAVGCPRNVFVAFLFCPRSSHYWP